MYKVYLTSFFALSVLLTSVAQAKVGVEYLVSRMHGLFDFALAVAGYPHQAESMVRIFELSREKTPSVVAAVAALDHLHSSLEAGVEFVTPVASRTRGESVHQILLGQSFFAKDLADFQIRATGLLTPNDQAILFDSLAKLEPVFDRLVWKNSEKALNDHRRKLEALARKAKLDEMFEKAVTFYGAKWPSGLPFTVGLYPTPFVKEKGFRNGTHSSSQGTIEEHGVMMVKDEEDLAGSFGTIFHELCHSLYASQTDQEMIEFEKAFETNRSRHSILAYNYINEALATALGNGWAAEKAAGRLDCGSWYTNPYIDGFAKAIFPIVKENVEHAKKMDAAFVSKVIDAFAQKFPEAPYEFEALFNRVVIVTESMTSSDLRHAFRNRFAISSYSGGAPLGNAATKKDADAFEAALVTVIAPDELGAFEKFAADFPFLKKHVTDIKKMKPNEFYSALDESGRAYVVIKAKAPGELESAVAKMKSLAKIDPKQPVRSI